MKGKAILLATLMIVSMAVAGVGGASAASATDSVQESIQQPVQLQENATNATPQASGNDDSDSSLPEGVDVPQSELKNATLDESTRPSRLASEKGGAYTVSSKEKASSASVTGAAYNPNPNQLTWLGYDGTGQAGTYYFKDYTLRAAGPHVEVWVANNLSWPTGDDRQTPKISDQQAAYLADQFETNIYPKESQIFRNPDFRNGSDASLYGPPGPNGTVPDGYYETSDNTSRTVLLVDNLRDENYYNSSYPVYTAGLSSPTVDDYTDRNVAFIDAANWDERLGGPDAPWKPEDGDTRKYGVEGTTAHEYQHILHSDADPDEDSWIQEGFSDYAIYATGYGLDEGHVGAYEDHPENSLTQWGDQGQVNILRDYGGAFLFQLYLDEQFGTDFLKAEFNSEKNGIQGVEDALDQTGADRSFYQVYQDFQTMLVTDGTDAPDQYQLNVTDLDVNTQKDDSRTRNNLTAAYGNAYNPLDPKSGSVDSLTVSGEDFTQTPWSSVSDPLDETDHEVLYSGKGNGLDNFAIFDADLSGTDSPTLDFDTYYDIEKGWDYGFVQVSTDSGETWESLENDDTTSYKADPPNIDSTVKKNLPGFTGNTSDQWVNEQFDLSQYAGQDVLVAFRYVTDGAAINPGFYARNISVSGTDIDYDGSSAEPFQSLREAQQDYLRYQFSLLGIGEDGSTEVQQYNPTEFSDNGSADLEPLLDGDYDQTILTASWAPETEEGGTVPYGYDVNAGGDIEPPAGENTLTIRGTGDPAQYALSVTDTLEKSTANGANINGNDEIRRGYVGDGQVGISADSYTFDGTLETIHVTGDAEVFLNGRQLSDDEIASMPNKVIEIEGSGDAAAYAFAATDGNKPIQKVTANNANLNANDKTFRTTGNGQVGISKDAYGFNGVVDSLNVDGDANVYVNGRQVDPADEQDHMITIVGTGDRATYQFTVDEPGLAPSNANYANTNGNDVINGMTKTGQIGLSADSNDYNGDITAFDVSGADVQVYIDGEQVDEDDVADEA